MAGFSSSEHAQGDDLLPWIAGEESKCQHTVIKK
jgi:hypothetical protein